MNSAGNKRPQPVWRAAFVRVAGFFVFWVALAGANPADLPIGLAAAGAATWASISLLPPSPIRPRIHSLALLGLHFVWSSIVAGVDVARRALHPRLPLRPGFVNCSCRCPAGTSRNVFLAMTSLMPGSLPISFDEQDTLLMHCLDTEQSVADQMADSEARLMDALAERETDG